MNFLWNFGCHSAFLGIQAMDIVILQHLIKHHCQWILSGIANCFEQQTSKSARISISCCFSPTRAIISPSDFWKYFVMLSSFIHAFYFKVHNGNLKSAVQKDSDETYPFLLFWGCHNIVFWCTDHYSNFRCC